MTRMWLLVPQAMCDEHLQREHWEIHQLVEQINCEWDMPPEHQVMKVLGHCVRGQVFPKQIHNRHFSLAKEMAYRDIGHDSPLEDIHPWVIDSSPMPTKSLVDHNAAELSRRCDKCAERVKVFYDVGRKR